MSSLWFNLEEKSTISRRDGRHQKDNSLFLRNLFDRQWASHWSPNEISLLSDKKDIERLSDVDSHIFISNISYQVLMDSKQEKEPSKVLLPLSNDTDLDQWINIWVMFETIHSRTYSNFLEFVMKSEKLTETLDNIEINPFITSRANTIDKYYRNLEEISKQYLSNTKMINDTEFFKEISKHLILVLTSVNYLEGIRFFLSFACAFSFTRRKKAILEKNAKLMELILKDEVYHVTGTQFLLNRIRNGLEGNLFKEVFLSLKDEMYFIWDEVKNQEYEWAEYLVQKGETEGLTLSSMKQYVDYVANNRLNIIQPELSSKVSYQNPFPYMNSYLSSSSNQIASQETQNSSYVTSFEFDIQNVNNGLLNLL
jgi:ribonucleoside-diphosphate reductase beta chain